MDPFIILQNKTEIKKNKKIKRNVNAKIENQSSRNHI